ncbi:MULTISPECIES: hypothetical protein [Burkholderia]|uniref:Succinylglutamate desuccinylase/aspartoacylase n=1 Tax=Burkholderia aenigmatica TaxID=2015348 RepID=A0ABY6XYJ8_9BURK|nr:MULTISPECIES: hypothetical protein [Burkholderia]VWD05449.1 succinylglutamate desuccinylase/aspartoacylase [Burkholderia aenigmatica]VWD08867.1 succinylglutamate desuccinylase/aspartoacylase [Burkholderia aenigmatica]
MRDRKACDGRSHGPDSSWAMRAAIAVVRRSLECGIATAGTEIQQDDDKTLVTLYDRCVVVQPSMWHFGVNVKMMWLRRLLDH